MVFGFFKSSFQKIKSALSKTRSLLGEKLRSLFRGKLDEEALEQLEQILYEADLGVVAAQQLANKIREIHRNNPEFNNDRLLEELKKEVLQMLKGSIQPTNSSSQTSPQVILVVGVNGNGKTTTVAKLANRYKSEGKKVIIAAADTFRAAATEQLELWAASIAIDLVKGNPKSDPAAVTFDAVSAGIARRCDVVIVDTAGRLHTKTPLMQELDKIKRSCKKVIPESPHEILLVLDASVGQNAIEQAKIFHQFTPLTGIVLTKLDGTAKGGIVIAIQEQLGIPVKFIGLGEGIQDLEVFDPDNFVEALFD